MKSGFVFVAASVLSASVALEAARAEGHETAPSDVRFYVGIQGVAGPSLNDVSYRSGGGTGTAKLGRAQMIGATAGVFLNENWRVGVDVLPSADGPYIRRQSTRVGRRLRDRRPGAARRIRGLAPTRALACGRVRVLWLLHRGAGRKVDGSLGGLRHGRDRRIVHTAVRGFPRRPVRNR